MADTTNQRILTLALAGFGPLDIAEFLNTTVSAVIAALCGVEIDLRLCFLASRTAPYHGTHYCVLPG